MIRKDTNKCALELSLKPSWIEYAEQHDSSADETAQEDDETRVLQPVEVGMKYPGVVLSTESYGVHVGLFVYCVESGTFMAPRGLAQRTKISDGRHSPEEMFKPGTVCDAQQSVVGK